MTSIEEEIGRLTGHRLNDVTDRVRTIAKPCPLLSGEESYFVGMFADYVRVALRKKKFKLPYAQFVYSPSRRTEWKLGFDLSIGRINTDYRLRTMHKVLYGVWCDADWEWPMSKPIDKLHMATLIADGHVHKSLRPYLVLHVVYCIHDYRRMGFLTDDGWVIPPVKSLLRTVVIDLLAVADLLPSLKAINWNELSCRLSTCSSKIDALRLLKNYPIQDFRIKKAVPDANQGLTIANLLNKAESKGLFKLLTADSDIPLRQAILSVKEFVDLTHDWTNAHWLEEPNRQGTEDM